MAKAAAAGGAGIEDARARGFFGRIFLFLRQVLAELKKVVTPTGRELVNLSLIHI